MASPPPIFAPPPEGEPIPVSEPAQSPAPEANPLDLIDFIVYLVAGFLCAEIVFPLIVIGIWVSAAHLTQTQMIAMLENPTATESLVLQFSLDLGLLVPAVILVKLRHRASMRTLGWVKTKWYWFVATPLIALFLEGVSMVIVDALTAVTKSVPTYQCELIKHQYGNALLLAIVASCIFAPLAEETVFRGFIYGYLRKRMPIWLAVILSGGIFAIAHADLQLFIPLWIMGCILAVMYQKSKSIFPNMLVHGLFNLVGIILIIKFPC